MNLSLKNLDRLCLAILVMVLTICALWVAKFSGKQRHQIQQENAVYARSINNINLAETNLQYLRAAEKIIQSELTVFDKKVPKAAEIGMFLKQLHAMIKHRNIVLINLQPQPEVRENYFTKIPIRLLFKGSFNDIYDLLYELETMNRLLTYEKITISKTEIHAPCQADLTINVFERL